MRYTHDCTRTIRATVVCVRHQPNEGRKVHSYCINSSLSFLSRAHLNQQKAPGHPIPVRALLVGPSTHFLPVPLLILHPPPARHSSTELNPTLASPKKPSSCFRATLEPTLNPGKGCCTSLLVRVPFVPYGGLATNDSCYSFATQFSLRSAVPPAHSPPPPRVHSSRSPLFFWHVCPGSFRFPPVDY